MARPVPEISWFSALCDDDYEFLGVPDPQLRSSWAHCRDIVQAADRNGFDNILLPSGYQLGIEIPARDRQGDDVTQAQPDSIDLAIFHSKTWFFLNRYGPPFAGDNGDGIDVVAAIA